MASPSPWRIALWQTASQPGDVAGNLARLDAVAARAAARGARLLITPEMVVTGYNIGASEVSRLAQTSGGAAAQAVSAIAARHDLAIVYGYAEQRADDAGDGAVAAKPYNAAQLIGPDGVALAHYRKTHLYGELDRAQFSASPGGFPVVTLDGWRIGLLICYDVEFPECARLLALAGADLIAVPTANMQAYDVVPDTLVPARAIENGVVVAYANYCGREGDIDYGGRSIVAGADGAVLAQADRDEALLIVDLDASRVQAARAAYTPLRDRRPTLYGALTDPEAPASNG